MVRRILVLMAVFLIGAVSGGWGAPPDVVTVVVREAGADPAAQAAACKEAVRRALVEAGVDRQIRAATRNGRFPKRYLLKIAHNNGAGVDGFRVAGNGEMPGYLWAVTKSLLDFFADALREPLTPEDRRLVQQGEIMTRRLHGIAPAAGPVDGGSAPPRRVIGLKLTGSTVKLILSLLARLTRTPSWNVVGYPAVSNPLVVAAWAELVREWGGEPWVGDLSGIESPDTLDNMRASGILAAALRSGARLWVFDRGLVAETVPGGPAGQNGPFLADVDGERLDAFETVTSPVLADYPGQEILLPRALVRGFFAGVFCEAHPKAHVLSTVSSAVKNLVGLMGMGSRRAMHNMQAKSSPWGVVGTHDRSSHRKIAQTAYAVERLLGREIVGYLGDSFASITAIGPDTGPHTVFPAGDRTVTFARDLFRQETATLAVSSVAARHVAAHGSRYPRLQFNRFFRGGNPRADDIYAEFCRLALAADPRRSRFTWRLCGVPERSALLTDLRTLLDGPLSDLPIDLQPTP
ncbi:MAG: DUF362 domain-containing protein [Candidatus Riflebacteria bacterium]|nr:DUF362 domain-containing protein [Candidatus Riflebacteria bacterium]